MMVYNECYGTVGVRSGHVHGSFEFDPRLACYHPVSATQLAAFVHTFYFVYISQLKNESQRTVFHRLRSLRTAPLRVATRPRRHAAASPPPPPRLPSRTSRKSSVSCVWGRGVHQVAAARERWSGAPEASYSCE